MMGASEVIARQSVEIPFELWLLLVVVTGGLYLLAKLFSGKRKISILDNDSLLKDVAMGLLSRESGQEGIDRAFDKYDVKQEERSLITNLVRVTLHEILSLDESQIDPAKTVLNALESRNIPTDLARRLLIIASDALAVCQAKADAVDRAPI
jgi:hypothetical protein